MNHQHADIPQVHVPTHCPIKGGSADLTMLVNIFREKGHVEGCSLLKPGESCAHTCLVDEETKTKLHVLIREEQDVHHAELGEIGHDVVP